MRLIRTLILPVLLILLIVAPTTYAQTADCNAACATSLVNYVNGDPSAKALKDAGNLSGLADYLNAPASPTFYVYRSSIPVIELFNAITWANFTPADAVPTADVLSNAIFQSRQLSCQTKQMNVQTMLTGRDYLDGRNNLLRAGLQDALTNLPSGTNGALRSAGWVTVRDTVIARSARLFEKVLADTAGGSGATASTAAVATVEGLLDYSVFIGR